MARKSKREREKEREKEKEKERETERHEERRRERERVMFGMQRANAGAPSVPRGDRGDEGGLGGRTPEDGTEQQQQHQQQTQRKRKRIQLKMEDFTRGQALPYIYDNFYNAFRDSKKKKNVSSLIQLYYRWQHWAFPGFGFKDFVEKAQTFGGSYVFKKELEELRKDAISICSRQGLVSNTHTHQKRERDRDRDREREEEEKREEEKRVSKIRLCVTFY